MPLISRLYTPSTCTLEITAQTSALSRWLRRPVIQSLQFLLQFEGQSGDPIIVAGDQDQLEALSTTVNTYVQSLLAQSRLDRFVDVPPSEQAPSNIPFPSVVTPSLRPQSQLTHELNLGPLATDTSGPTIPLKMSQLFDLAEALDSCAAELTALPMQTAQTPVKVTPIWARSAAVMVLLVGASAVTVQLLQTAQQPSGTSESSISQRDQPTQLPPPAGASSSPRANRKPQQRPSLPKVTLPSRTPSANQPNAVERAPASPSPNLAPFRAKQQLPSRSTSQTLTTPSIAAAPPTPPQPTVPGKPIPNNSTSSEGSLSGEQDVDSTAKPTADIAQEENRPDEIAANPSSAVPPRTAPNPATPEIAASESTASIPPNPPTFGGAGRSTPARDQSELLDQQETTVRPSPTTATRLADVIPQVAQVRQYLAQRWQAPADLNQTLQYTLILNPDGSLQQVTPRGRIAEEYRDRLPLPNPNQPFVSPLNQPSNPKIRLVLSPNGQIQTFLESRD